MRRKKRTEFTIETYERVFVRSSSRGTALQCPACAEPSLMITPGQAAALAAVSLRTIFHWIESGRVHFAEGTNHNLAVCLASLPAGKHTPG